MCFLFSLSFHSLSPTSTQSIFICPCTFHLVALRLSKLFLIYGFVQQWPCFGYICPQPINVIIAMLLFATQSPGPSVWPCITTIQNGWLKLTVSIPAGVVIWGPNYQALLRCFLQFRCTWYFALSSQALPISMSLLQWPTN